METARRMTEDEKERELLAECRRGNRRAFAELYEMHQRRVFSVALNFFGGQHARAEDVTQQVFLKIFNSLDSFRGDSQISTWIYRLTVNACIDERRRGWTFLPIGEFVETLLFRRTPVDAYNRREVTAEVRTAIGQLKEPFKMPIILRYSEGLSYEEIARVLDCTAGTVASRISRGHQILAKKLRHLRSEV